ncbi:MAG: carboxypeptidase regulatory-like domain-containing protein, partial [Chitinophagaceae bacterium]
MKLKLLLSFLVYTAIAIGQNNTQTIKGTVTDKISEKPLQSVTITINNQKTTTDSLGKFVIKNISIGRIVVNISAVGYKPVSIPEVLVTTGKEVVIDVALEQDVKALNEVTVSSSKIKKGNASNEFAGTSSRSFSMEEVTRFAGGRNDPSKLVSNFAGVISADDSRNDIIVRGNSPSGVLWRLEGIPTPNPNHYSTSGST